MTEDADRDDATSTGGKRRQGADPFAMVEGMLEGSEARRTMFVGVDDPDAGAALVGVLNGLLRRMRPFGGVMVIDVGDIDQVDDGLEDLRAQLTPRSVVLHRLGVHEPGTEGHDATVDLLSALGEARLQNVDIVIVVGSFTPHLDRLVNAIRQQPHVAKAVAPALNAGHRFRVVARPHPQTQTPSRPTSSAEPDVDATLGPRPTVMVPAVRPTSDPSRDAPPEEPPHSSPSVPSRQRGVPPPRRRVERPPSIPENATETSSPMDEQPPSSTSPETIGTAPTSPPLDHPPTAPRRTSSPLPPPPSEGTVAAPVPRPPRGTHWRRPTVEMSAVQRDPRSVPSGESPGDTEPTATQPPVRDTLPTNQASVISLVNLPPPIRARARVTVNLSEPTDTATATGEPSTLTAMAEDSAAPPAGVVTRRTFLVSLVAAGVATSVAGGAIWLLTHAPSPRPSPHHNRIPFRSNRVIVSSPHQLRAEGISLA